MARREPDAARSVARVSRSFFILICLVSWIFADKNTQFRGKTLIDCKIFCNLLGLLVETRRLVICNSSTAADEIAPSSDHASYQGCGFSLWEFGRKVVSLGQKQSCNFFMGQDSDIKKGCAAESRDELLNDIRTILVQAKVQVARQVNSELLSAYWQVGRHIVEYEQRGKTRADYGTSMLKNLSEKLVAEFGNSFNLTNLKLIRLLYLRFPKGDALRHQLNWTHYRELLKVKEDAAMKFYLDECVACGWSTRQLQRQINTLYYERLLASRDKTPVIAEANSRKAEETVSAKEIIRDPYILEFLGIPQGEHFLESNLEQMLITRLQHFLLELGRGFTFVARQKRISFDNKHFFIDLVFYNILTRSYVLIDLKTGELTHQDIGQMQMYVNYYTRELMNPGDNPPIGIVLCAEKNDTIVRYTLPEGQNQIYASQYITYMPSEEELKKLLEQNNEF